MGEVDPIGEVITAGAYVVVEGLLAFVVGPTAEGDRLGVVRLGGHREGDETGWACARREVREEASLEIRPLAPPATHWLGPPHDPTTVHAGPAPPGAADEATPILVAWRIEDGERRFSVMYLATAAGTPEPSGEVKGLLLLRHLDVLALAGGTVTLAEYLRAGGRAILRIPLAMDVPLQPFLQLRVLAELLRRDPRLVPDLR